MNACFHCGLPVPAGAVHRAAVLGALRDFCCAGCEAVAGTIAAAGFESYYATRTAPAVKPPDAPPPIAVSARQSEAALILENVRCSACLWLIERQLQRHDQQQQVASREPRSRKDHREQREHGRAIQEGRGGSGRIPNQSAAPAAPQASVPAATATPTILQRTSCRVTAVALV